MEIYNRLKKHCPKTSHEFLLFVTSIMKWSEFEKSSAEYIYLNTARFYGYSLSVDPAIEYDQAIDYLLETALKYEKSVIFVKENNIEAKWNRDIEAMNIDDLFEMFETNKITTRAPEFSGFCNAINTSNSGPKENNPGMIAAIKKSVVHLPEKLEPIDLTPLKGDMPF